MPSMHDHLSCIWSTQPAVQLTGLLSLSRVSSLMILPQLAFCVSDVKLQGTKAAGPRGRPCFHSTCFCCSATQVLNSHFIMIASQARHLESVHAQSQA